MEVLNILSQTIALSHCWLILSNGSLLLPYSRSGLSLHWMVVLELTSNDAIGG